MKLLGVILALVAAARAANILIAYETARRSHHIWIGELTQALMKLGHNITLGGSFAKAIPEDDLYHPITFEGIFLTHYKFNKTSYLDASPFEKVSLNFDYNFAICNRTYQSNGFRTLWHYPDDFTFDLILLDITFGPCLYPLIERFGRPYTIGFTPSALTPHLSKIFGNGDVLPSYIGSPILEPFSYDSFLKRFNNYIAIKYEEFFKSHVEKSALQSLASRLLNATFHFDELEKAISLIFVNEHPLLNEAKALTPNIITVGGMHIRKLEPMPGILQSIIENANQGVVFFSSGTDIQQTIFSKQIKTNFANAFYNLVQKTVIWKDNIADEDHPFNDKPSNILIHKWIPQNEVLGHLHTKLLVTTGGTLTIQEAIFHGVPVVGIPIYDEHHRNMRFIVENHLGVILDYRNLTEENIAENLNKVLSNPIYLHNMEEMAKKFRDQPQSPLQRAIYWVQYVLKNNATGRATFLNPKTRFESRWTVWYTDVELFLLTSTLLFVLIVVKIVQVHVASKKNLKKKKKTKKDL